MRRTFVHIFKLTFMEILYYFYVSVWKNFGGIVEKICNYWYRYRYRYQRKYRHFPISISIDTFPITNSHSWSICQGQRVRNSSIYKGRALFHFIIYF